MMKPEPERRRFRRLWAEGTAVLSIGGSDYAAPLVDLSLKGALVGRPAGLALAVEAPAALVITLGSDGPRIAMDARIAHVDANSLGLCWQHIDLDSISELRRFVELNLGDGEVLDRELRQLFS